MDFFFSTSASDDISEIFSTILATISEDRAAGTTSHEEANLKSLDQGRGALSLKTDTVGATAALRGNHALQDYQMQLMLLEQQNKKRLMMARAEQDQVFDNSEPAEPIPLLDKSNGGTSRSIQDDKERVQLEKVVEQEKIVENTRDSSKKRKAGPGTKPKSSRKRRLAIPTSTDATYPNPPTKRKATRHSKINKENYSDVALTKNIVSPNPSLVSSPAQIHIPTLHRIVCQSRCHPTDLFADLPQRLSNNGLSQGHFSGAEPVYDVEEFLSQCGEVGFLVFKDYRCATRHKVASPNRQDALESASISIASIELQELISEIAECPLVRVNFEPKSEYYLAPKEPMINEFEIPSPYNFFFHHRAQLLAKANSHMPEDDIIIPHSTITTLLQYLEDDQGHIFREADDLFKCGQTTFQHLQRLFRPNEVVIARLDNVCAAYVLRDWPTINQNSSWNLSCWSWGYDGLFFNRRDTNLTLHYRLGEVAQITDLGVFPLRFASEDLKAKLIARGKHFWDMRYKHYVSYNGWDFKREEIYSSARCMIDYQTYRKFHQHAEAFIFSKIPRHAFDQRFDKFSSSNLVNDEDYLLMPAQIHGFILKEKKWGNLLVDQVTPVHWDKDAFKRLVIPPKTKDLVKALISVRTTARGNQQGMNLAGTRDDLITGKGNGLIMLLHGGPGTGKTLTAESVAEIAEMPLYSVTCGDIGTTPEGVEKYLKTILYLGKTWNCVLLLDEADVFLEERTLQDLERNSLVSVFLRVLEYYEGILILTSNRVGIFDEAFKSRIQVALHYQSLTPSSRRKIWQNFLDMLQNDKKDVDFQDLSNHLEELSEYEMNGREIRNALMTARQIALYKNETLSWDHVEVTINTARDFTRYLGKLHGHTEEQWAREKKER